jgi:hypothetical protein
LTKDALKSAALLGAGCLIAFLLLEVFLRVYGPLQTRLRGGDIILFPYKRYEVKNDRLPKLEAEIVRSNNSLGFRGPELPADPAKALTVIAVGGSTTEGFYLSDGKSWPERLGAALAVSFEGPWVNNAGMDGHSTFGHEALLKSYIIKLKPKAVVFLTGLNDMGLSSASRFDRLLTENKERPFPARALVWAAARSRVFSLLQNLLLYSSAIKAGLVHAELDLKTMKTAEPPAGHKTAMLARHAEGAAAYARRLEGLVKLCRDNGMEPVLVTQPLLCGRGKDPVTGADLEKLATSDEYVNCAGQWTALELYNAQTRRLGRELKVTVSDLAANLPKDSRYYYDFSHFTAEGAQKVSDLVYRDVCRPFAALSPATFKSCPKGDK